VKKLTLTAGVCDHNRPIPRHRRTRQRVEGNVAIAQTQPGRAESPVQRVLPEGRRTQRNTESKNEKRGLCDVCGRLRVGSDPRSLSEMSEENQATKLPPTIEKSN